MIDVATSGWPTCPVVILGATCLILCMCTDVVPCKPHLQQQHPHFKLEEYMVCPKKGFEKSRFLENGLGGGVDRLAVTHEPSDQFTFRLKFWKLDKKIWKLERNIGRVLSTPWGWKLRLKSKEGKKLKLFPVPRDRKCTEWPHLHPRSPNFFYFSSTQARPQARAVGMPTLSFQVWRVWENWH